MEYDGYVPAGPEKTDKADDDDKETRDKRPAAVRTASKPPLEVIFAARDLKREARDKEEAKPKPLAEKPKVEEPEAEDATTIESSEERKPETAETDAKPEEPVKLAEPVAPEALLRPPELEEIKTLPLEQTDEEIILHSSG